MFTDIRGFTSFSEKRTPEEVIAMLNRYLGFQAQIVPRYEGSIDKFVGDEMVALFIGARALEHAIECAVEIQRCVRQEHETLSSGCDARCRKRSRNSSSAARRTSARAKFLLELASPVEYIARHRRCFPTKEGTMRSYEEIFQEKFKGFCSEHKRLQAWQARLELKRLYPGLFQAVFAQNPHEKYMGAVDFHMAEGHAADAARQMVVEHAPELSVEMEGDED
jgi:hypothetical protein